MTRQILHVEYLNIQQEYAKLTTNEQRRAFCRQNGIHIRAAKLNKHVLFQTAA